MPLYRYHALDGDGRKLNGVEEAPSAEAAMDALGLRKLFVTKIEETRDGVSRDWRRFLRFRPRFSPSDLVLFCRRLSTLVASGIPLLESLSAIRNQTEKESLKLVLGDVVEDVRQGRSFSQAIAKHPGVFPELMISMVRVGETGGILAPVLEQLADFAQRDYEVRTEVRSAMAYPLLVLGLAVLTVIFLLLTVVRRLAVMFEGMQATLPLPTKILMAVSDFTTSYGIFVLIGLIAGGVLLRRWLKSPNGREQFDAWQLRLPLFGTLARKSMIARFSRSLAALLKGGVTLMEGLDVVNRVIGNVVLGRAVERVKERVQKGESMTRGLEKEKLFPEMVRYMISAGEESGNLDEMLHKVADIYELETRAVIRVMVSLLPPVLILFVAGIVGFIAFAMLLPIFEINQMIG